MARADVSSSPSSSTVPKHSSALQSATFAASGWGTAAENTPSPSSAATANPFWAVGADQYRHINRSLRAEPGQVEHADLRALPLSGFAGEQSFQAAHVFGDLAPGHRSLAQGHPAGKA